MVEPIRDILYSPLQGEQMEVDKRWVKSLSKQIQGAEVELVANLGETRVTFDQILSMQVGDVIPINIPESIHARVGDVPVMECRYGIINGQYALKVNAMLTQIEAET